MRSLAISALALATAAGAGFDPARWKYRAPIGLDGPAPMAEFPLGRALYERLTPRQSDLRVVCDGREQPFVIERRAGSVEQREIQATMLDKSVAAGPALEVTLDAGKAVRHSAVRFLVSVKNFRYRVRIETSDNRRSWSLARDDGHIFDFTEGGQHAEMLSVSYPVSTRRYVRSAIFGLAEPDALKSASLAYRLETPVEWETIATLAPAQSEDLKTQSTLLDLDLGVTGLPCSRVGVEAGGAAFSRVAEVELSDDRKLWGHLASGTFYQIGDESSLALSFPEQYSRYYRLRIVNRDNTPIQVKRVILETPRRLVRFPADAVRECWLYLGNPGAGTPQYDLPQILARRTPVTPALVRTGAVADNPVYTPPPDRRPWTEKHPRILTGGLTVAAVAMAALAYRLLRSPGAAQT